MLPLGAAVVLALTSAAPGAADPDTVPEAALGDVRVELAELRAGMETLRRTATERIERYRRESTRLAELTEAREAAEERAESADGHRARARTAAAQQAATAYMGGDLSMVHAWTGPNGPDELLERGAYLTLLGEHRTADLDRAEAARIATGTLAEVAETVEEEQAEAAEAARTAREEAEAAVAEQEGYVRTLVEEQSRLEARLAEERDPDAEEERHEEALANARTAAAPPEAAAEGSSDHGCTPGSVAAHTNGRIPEALLCPLPQPGERLRADAAQAFIELDGAFRSEFGRRMCVADSYRPYHEQVRLFEEMLPGMAARPGTSQHGLGVAVDLCGGVHRVGTPEHEWMLATAPDYGWDNPSWARDGFEPWHWEYTP
ncbi:M15 family metallopeptidase [Nocardiopsis aegyptia]|uniref:Biotin carboxyl carrier protein n=1 Tax=Nocardiopsis aegyptia TaxID=220378 RepID=A0A7Z0J948_9ACTN|nr:M15 family metallopeptidase [Nocardiopsis aegyptia]NYJ33392.1 biotin carboxyl carrier protein [Nocardiopsis aegyptia]